MKKILATSILFTVFVTASGCGHMMGHKHHDHSHAACACDKNGTACKGDCAHDTAAADKKGDKKPAGCTDCAKGS